MSTNYLERQSSARGTTFWLIAMFLLSTLAVVATISIVVGIGLSVAPSPDAQMLASPQYSWQVPVLAGLATLALILGGSFFKVMQLRAGGGAYVAESQGGVQIFPDTRDPLQRRILNIVEEMAIAAGTPVPPVYFLPNEPGINAFAAGYSPQDAVMAVTRGAAEELTRDELQGVVAHEFSHILNADMKIGIRLMGILYGILLLGLVGQMVLRTAMYSGMGSRRDSKSGNSMMVIYMIALAAVVLGFVGTFLGNLIKAAVSRQRERLADASGVQFTRNPAGLAGALKRIGGLQYGSKMQSPNAAEASHLFFAEGVWGALAGLWSSHPPLAERIRELDPSWDGVYPPAHAAARTIAAEMHSPPPQANFNVAAFADATSASSTNRSIPLGVVKSATDYIGNPQAAHSQYAARVVDSTHDQLLAAAREIYSARALIFCLLLHDEPGVRTRQLQQLSTAIEPSLLRVVSQLIPLVDALDARARLPLVDMSLPALAAMTRKQYSEFVGAVNTLVQADGRLDLFEWTLFQIIRRNLQARFDGLRSPPGKSSLQKYPQQCALVLSSIAYAGNSDEKAREALQAAAKILNDVPLQLLSRDACQLVRLQPALTDLLQVSAAGRIRLIQSCAAAITADAQATLEEAELIRGISDLLNCPMPPMLPT